MDLDSALQRYLADENVANWLFSTQPLTSVSSSALSSSFVYALGFGVHPAPRTMHVEDMLIVTGYSNTFVMGVVWGLNLPHIFARTPLMLDKTPKSRRFAVDLSSKDALEFMEFLNFDDGMVVTVFRRFLHTRDGALPVIVSARLHDAGPVPGIFGPVRMRAEVIEAANCPSCGQATNSCHCEFDTSPPTAIIPHSTHSWNQFTTMIMSKSNHGVIKLRMYAHLAGHGEIKVVNDMINVLNILQKGDTEYCNLLRRKAVHGLGVNVVVPTADSVILPFADETDFINLHNDYIARKRTREDEDFIQYQYNEQEQEQQVAVPSTNVSLPTGNQTIPKISNITFDTNTDSVDSVEDPIEYFGSFFQSADSPNTSSGLVRKPTPTYRDTPNAFTTQTSEQPSTLPQLLPNEISPPNLQQTPPLTLSQNDILRHVELILSPPKSNEPNAVQNITQREMGVTTFPQPAPSLARCTSSASSEDSMHPRNKSIKRKPNTTKRTKPTKQFSTSEETTEEEKKHACDKCSSKFKMRGDLLRHVKIVHQGKKMYTCETCGKAFGHSGHLNRHISSVHLQQRRFGCQFCGFHFYQASHLQSHIRHIHTAKKKFECKKCGKHHSDQNALDAHSTSGDCIPKRAKRRNTGKARSAGNAVVENLRRQQVPLNDNVNYSLPQLYLQTT